MGSENCLTGVCEPQRTQGLEASPANGKTYDLVKLRGPGLFLGAEMVKQGGSGDLTFVILEIDGRNVVNASYAAIKNWGLTHQNPFGLVLLEAGSIKNVTMGFPSPLRFANSLKLSATVSETGVAQIVANVIHGK